MTLRFSSRTPFVSSLALLALLGCGGMSAEELSPEHDANRVRTSEDDTNASEAAEEAEDVRGGQGEAEEIAATEQARVEPEPPLVAPVATAAPDSAGTVIEVPLAEAATPNEPTDGDTTDGETTDGETTDGETTDGETTDGEEEPGFELEIVDDLSVLVIFDNSGSMSGYWDGSSRWAVANQALYDAFAPVATSLKVAAIRFPIEGECGVPDFTDQVHFDWQLAGEFLEEWQAQAVGPTGGTPMGQAFLAADEAIAQAKEQGLLEDRFNVIVLTDGEPNCETDTGLLTTLPAHWNEMGVKTHVLGLPGSSTAAELLNQIAVAGGTGEFVSLGEVSSDQLVHEVTARAR